jgi:hypothetical protein
METKRPTWEDVRRLIRDYVARHRSESAKPDENQPLKEDE